MTTDSEITNEKVTLSNTGNFENYFKGLEIADGSSETEINPVSETSLTKWEDDFKAQTKNILTQNAFARNQIVDIIAKGNTNEQSLKDRYLFNVTVDTIGSPSFLNNQKSSGRCWIFASSNVFRAHVIKDYNLKDDSFQISQSYLYFYDKLEKANFFLENIQDTVDEDLGSRLINYLFSAPVNDGGQWDMIVNLVNKYGLVPNEVFPDNAQSTNSSKLNYIVTEKLREYGLKLRDLIKGGAPKDVVTSFKASAVKSIYKTIALALGTPPKPTDEFVWEFIDKDGKYKSYKTNPLDFYKTHVKFDAGEHFSLIHDPRNEYNKLYTVERLNNISGGKPIEYVNLEIDEIKKVAIKQLKDNEPIFFGSDVGKFSNSKTGILDTTAYDYSSAFDFNLEINKSQRLKVGSSQMTHAMVITGVHLDPETNKPVRWKIENSWGDESGDKGWFLMTDDWFNEYVFQIVTNKKYAPKKAYDIWKSKEFNVLPFYDPMGALA
ncbi:LAP3 Cysteine proteinase 1 [Candida maltosa Xu316]